MIKCPKENYKVLVQTNFSVFKMLKKLENSNCIDNLTQDIEKTLDDIECLKNLGLKTQE